MNDRRRSVGKNDLFKPRSIPHIALLEGTPLDKLAVAVHEVVVNHRGVAFFR